MKYPLVKEALSRLGTLVPTSVIHHVNGVLNYLHVGRWMHERGFSIPVRVSGRLALYEFLVSGIEEPVSYLEFGVFDGESMRRWSKLLKDPASTLHGFDSFEGLPEDWGLVCTKEVFDVHGKIPIIDDARVHFVKGWFSDTLPGFLKSYAPHPRLIVHLDADLHSSTAYVLEQLRPFLHVGTTLIFDEFFDREHETKAFGEFLKSTRARAECLAATRALTQVAFRLTDLGQIPNVGAKT